MSTRVTRRPETLVFVTKIRLNMSFDYLSNKKGRLLCGSRATAVPTGYDGHCCYQKEGKSMCVTFVAISSVDEVSRNYSHKDGGEV